MYRKSVMALSAPLLAIAAVAAVSPEAGAFRMIQNTTVGRVSAGYAVPCNDPNGFAHWTKAEIPWYHNTANQGSNKATAIQNGLASWNAVSPAAHNLTYAGTTTAGFVTDGRNTVLWARGNGCNGTCLAITALVLASGQVITETDVSFNDRYSWNTNGSNYDAEAVWAHEAGHGLGIHHTEITSTPRPTMYASYFGVDGRSLEQDDKDALNCAHNRYPPTVAQVQVPSPASELALSDWRAEMGMSSRSLGDRVLIRFRLREAEEVRLDIHDIAGRRVTTLLTGSRGAGEHEVAWDGMTPAGPRAAGVYFARLSTTEGIRRSTVLLAR